MASAAVSLGTMKGYLQSIRFSGTAFLPIAILCIGAVSLAGVSALLAANTVPPGVNQPLGIKIEEEDGEKDELAGGKVANPSSTSNQCFLLISTCPVDNPRCGSAPMAVPILCTDLRCTPTACVKASEYRSSAASSRNNSGTNNPMCVLQTFSCAKNALPSCYKRIHSNQLECRDSACGAGSCTPLEVFITKNTFQPWDVGPLSGPFPRAETMCVIERSACPPHDPSCLSPVSIEQIPCSDARCAAGACTRMTIQVDAGDNIVSNAAVNPVIDPPKTNPSEPDETPENPEGKEDSSIGPIVEPTDVNVRHVPILGCFAEDGSWTTDRSLCAIDQARFTQGQLPPPPQESAEVSRETNLQIEKQFVPDTRRSALVQNLLSLTVEAVGRLSLILENPTLSVDLRMNLNETMEWLRAVQRTAAEDNQSINDVQMLADEVGKRLVDTRSAVLAWAESSGRPIRPSPQTFTDTMDTILLALPSAFALLQAEMIVIPDEAISGFLDAQALYESVKPACLANSNTCEQLNQVIDALTPVVAALKSAIDAAGRPDLEAQIDLLMQ